jgi:hypothetical protein
MLLQGELLCHSFDSVHQTDHRSGFAGVNMAFAQLGFRDSPISKLVPTSAASDAIY